MEQLKVANILKMFKKIFYGNITNFYNRDPFMNILQNYIANLRTYISNLTLLTLDINNSNLG
ncbi:MAG: hypothetical protein AMR96_04525 [Candidatus Adiutrix intracellularis]|jgi:GGDEF domain-containing protein|nr:MAG: hypothetical protein AMR96_04525 [Candidatus Adiutrix intracellularis]